MSGIVGIYHRNGAPVERAVLQPMVEFLSYRGPDSRECWINDSLGFGHTMLRTTKESENERQPASLEGRFWIVADARIDCRDELIAELRRAGRMIRQNAPDSELILQAYAAWDTDCVERLRGDFSFGIWDARNKQLFCARDHFGIKPFYYTLQGEFFLFSNTLNCIRLHPRVSKELNEAAIGDFLLFGLNYDNCTTSFRDIQRLSPAHSMNISVEGVKVRRYWRPPTDERIRYSNPVEYVQNFQSLFKAAVADRLRTDRVGILLSGGLDSSSVAAVAKEVPPRDGRATDIRGFTCVYESLIPDQEKVYAQAVAEFLSIPIKFQTMDNVKLFENWDNPEFCSPEPVDNPLSAGFFESSRIISSECRVLLSGDGNDNLMFFQMWPYVKELQRNGEWQRLMTEVANFLWVRPFPWRGIQARLLKLTSRDPDACVFPGWLAPDFVRRVGLEERWKAGVAYHGLGIEHPIHPKAYASLHLPHWTQLFEFENPGTKDGAVETRYPFLDLRIVNYLLAIPPFPWCFQKMLLREAMERKLPERVRARPKAPLQGEPVSARLQKTEGTYLSDIPWCADADLYINRSALMVPHGKMNREQIASNFRPYCLNIWLQSARRVRYETHAEALND